ncbi:uncharacterized protein LOC122869735 isoform X2 [Siniperca chuatsi]|uniref:uncharacterized protein LOC122869735 isoform X2 n=1 Tax=Siniperca chuatsi TaxID=119488 RepID=UPI001CE14C44|nr:uncharacterized protein LOC122869735 isoform X2 [Siniperca chuatsi]
MSLQVCHCGWSKVTTYHGLRTHQGKMGCTPRGVKVEKSEQQHMWGNVAFTNNQKDPKLDVDTSIKTDTSDYYPDMSLQVCHCGWSKVTTYHGLRTHQGKMGCTPRGVKVEKSEQQHMWGNVAFTNKKKDPKLDVDTSIKTDTSDYYPDMSLQVCHCGWSKVTTYHGLRTHQGKMGCTPRGVKVEKSEQQHMWGNVAFTNNQKDPKLDVDTSIKTDTSDYYPDMSLQVCHCGWSKVTTYHGLRTHQGKMGCTPRGVKVEKSEQQHMWGNVAFTNNQKDPKLDVYTSIKTDTSDYYPDMSLQVCHCGWSKVTTYHGLRTHQGKMGCTPRGVKVEKSEQQHMWGNVAFTNNQKDPKLDVYTSIKTDTSDYYPDMSLQVCHCGWSKVTTYHGLRTHQGKMGCTPRGVKVEKSEQQHMWGNVAFTNNQKDPKLDVYTSIKTDTSDYYPDMSLQVCHCGWSKVTTYHGLRTHQGKMGCTKGVRIPKREQYNWTNQWEEVDQRKHQPAKRMTVKKEVKELAQMFSATTTQETAVRAKGKHGEEQKLSQVKLIAEKISATTVQGRAVHPKEKDKEAQNLQKSQGSLDAEWLEINSVFSEVVRVVEDAKQKSPGLVFSIGTLRATTSTMMEQIHQKLENCSSIELKWISKFAVDVKLDQTAAHRCLVSTDGKKVSNGGENQKAPDAPGRFGSVLGINRLTSGKSYWEVVVSNKTGWDLGVARRDANCRRKLSLSPDNGYWVTAHYENEKYAALSAPPVSLYLKEKPKKVGVFMDYEEGLLSFYNVTAQSHIYSFTECSFTGEICPYFSLHLKDGESADPLIISTVKHQ